jgi:hypothetical protein
MKSKNVLCGISMAVVLQFGVLAGLPALMATQAAGLAATNAPSAIPWNEIGAKAGADYMGDGLAVAPTGSGARLHCVFQRLDGEATPEGLWLTSTVTNTVSDRFRVTAMAVGGQRPALFLRLAVPRQRPAFLPRPIIALNPSVDGLDLLHAVLLGQRLEPREDFVEHLHHFRGGYPRGKRCESHGGHRFNHRI